MSVIQTKSISGITSITTPSGADNLLTIHTSDTTERVRVNNSGDVIVGSGITLSPDGDVYTTGVTTATTFVGALTGNVTGNLSGNVTGDVTGTSSKVTITSGSDNRVITAAGADTLQGETNVVVNGGILIAGHTVSTTCSDGEGPFFQAKATDSRAGASFIRHSADASGGGVYIAKSRNATIGSNTVVQSGDELGRITFSGDDGTDINTPAAKIASYVDGTPGSNDMPGRLAFYTTADGASAASERMRIDSSGRVYIGNTYDATTSSDDLVIGSTSGDHGISVFSGTSDGGFICFGDTNSTGVGSRAGVIRYNHSDNVMKLATNGNNDRLIVGSSGDIEIVDGNLKVASGHGIDFSATADGTGGAAEILDDYEEGEFTPAYDAPDQASAGFAQYHQYGYYTKIGNTVTVNVYIQGHCNSNAGGGSNDDLKVTGLPFAPAQLPSGGNNRHQANWAIGSRYKLECDDLTAYSYGGQTFINLLVPTNGGTGSPLKTNQADQNTTQFIATATYRI